MLIWLKDAHTKRLDEVREVRQQAERDGEVIVTEMNELLRVMRAVPFKKKESSRANLKMSGVFLEVP